MEGRAQPAAELGHRRHLEKGLHRLLAQSDAEGDLEWAVAVDSTIVRAHQHAAGARSKAAPTHEPSDHALGRSRGGLSTKIHLAADGRCRPLVFVLTPGQAGDAPAFPQVMAHLRHRYTAGVLRPHHRRTSRTGSNIMATPAREVIATLAAAVAFALAGLMKTAQPKEVPRPVGRPRTTPDMILADKAYSSRAIRTHLSRRDIKAVTPQPADQIANRKTPGQAGGRPPAFDRDAYTQRNTVERCINRLKQWRGLAVRTSRDPRERRVQQDKAGCVARFSMSAT
ncbi:hypothetical protein JCM13580A_62050 [Streptomyces drozdowiczii]